ncbi:MAG: hypothetical protein LUF81_07680 [Clostridiales bacterium]|nr:hypothetical protein [Clostridiales bacterium]
MIVVVAAVLAVCFVAGTDNDNGADASSEVAAESTEQSENDESADEAQDAEGSDETEDAGDSDETEGLNETDGADAAEEEEMAESDDGQSGDESSVSDAELELETQEEAPYEHWLAAAVISGISMNYPDFEAVSYYASGTAELSGADASGGIYVLFTSDGEQLCIYAVPLQEERSEAGTVDVYSEVVGYATFDMVSASDIPAEYTEITIENLNDLITQSVRVMLCEH